MPLLKGSCRNAAAAIFVYKDDGRVQGLWDDILPSTQDKYMHIELRIERFQFLAALRTWNQNQSSSARKYCSETHSVLGPDPNHQESGYTPAMLMLHAHMGQQGIITRPLSPKELNESDDYSSPLIRWEVLATAIEKPLRLIWLCGCESDYAKPHLEGKAQILLTTPISVDASSIIPLFKHEVSIDPILFFDEMLPRLRSKIPSLSYHKWEQGAWQQAFENQGSTVE